MPIRTLFTGSTGLNNKVDSVRLLYDIKTGVGELSEAVDVYIDSTGRVSRQYGFDQLVSGNFHSLCPFDCGGYSLVMKGTSLWSIDHGGNLVGVRSGMTDRARVDYQAASDGMEDLVYYVNGYELGYVLDMVSHEWEPIPYVGKETDIDYSAPPQGAHLLTLFNGSMYLAVHNVLFASAHQDYSKYNYGEDYAQFRGRLKMVQPVKHGLFVSDDTAVYFLGGADLRPGDWKPFEFNNVSQHRVVEGCHTKIDAQYIPGDRIGEALLWYSSAGIFAGYDDGTVRNLTFNKLSNRVPASGNNYLPDGTFGTMAVINNEQLLVTIEP